MNYPPVATVIVPLPDHAKIYPALGTQNLTVAHLHSVKAACPCQLKRDPFASWRETPPGRGETSVVGPVRSRPPCSGWLSGPPPRSRAVVANIAAGSAQAVPESERVPGDVHDVGVVGEPVHQRASQAGIAQDLRPA